MNSPEVTPFVLVSSLISQQVFQYLYNHPDIKWVNKGTVMQLAAVVSGVLAVATAWGTGTLDQPTVQASVDAVWNFVIGAGAPIAMNEAIKFYTYVKTSFFDRLKGEGLPE